jgi:IclR family mhp operon transcriptional activator
MIGIRLPMLRTAAGRTYLAFCAAAERRAIVNHLLRVDDPADRPFLDPATFDRLIEETAARGYGVRTSSDEPIPNTSATKTSSIGVPIVAGSSVLGCITIIWLASALDLAEGIAQFFHPMRDAAAAVAALQLHAAVAGGAAGAARQPEG